MEKMEGGKHNEQRASRKHNEQRERGRSPGKGLGVNRRRRQRSEKYKNQIRRVQCVARFYGHQPAASICVHLFS